MAEVLAFLSDHRDHRNGAVLAQTYRRVSVSNNDLWHTLRIKPLTPDGNVLKFMHRHTTPLRPLPASISEEGTRVSPRPGRGRGCRGDAAMSGTWPDAGTVIPGASQSGLALSKRSCLVRGNE
jgi:hypothetical protein